MSARVPASAASVVHSKSSTSASSIAASSRKGGRGMGRDSSSSSSDARAHRQGGRGGRGGMDRINALGRLLTRILRHQASDLKLDMRSDGFVRVHEILKLNTTTFAGVPLRLHTPEEVRVAVARDNKQRFTLSEEDGELLIRANQGHSITTVSIDDLLKPILSIDEAPVCVHGTYRRYLESILQSGLKRMKRLHVHFSFGLPMDGEVISGMRRDVDVLIYLDVEKALREGMELFVSDNKVILTEGFDGVVPARFFLKIETWPGREIISFRT
ncbi:tRNA 2'-phosphotransferase 1 [Canna indica]|uniref:2'-phosphotransferase n=1 Tax=Canna indica TaxID=4628 RepID=A0AAQ3JK81_9LILI|nr:tRNA 2'-phosphotransferase 1 [Canna indica]